ncbi:MAG TPA: hypothetical protein VF484_11220, partial [Candidatus Limnocylindrales bacterium]
TPLVALAAALVLALVADASVNWRAWRGSFGTGRLVGSAVVISWGVGYGLGVALEAACVISNPIWAAETLVLPAVIGVGIVLLAIAWRRGRREVVSGGR